MRAVLLHAYGGPEQLSYEDGVSDPQVSGDTVLVAAAATSVNPIDWKVRSGARQKDFPLTLPAILGRDISGIVRAVGVNVRNFKVGERVMALTDKTYAELAAVTADSLTHLPDGLDLADAAALPLVAMTGDQLIRHATSLRPRERVLVTGALGSVGRAAVHSAKKLGAEVIAGVRKDQLDAARSLGVAGVLAIDDAEAVDRFAEVDAVADTVGGESAARLLPRVREGGSFGYASVLPSGAGSINPSVTIRRVYAKPDPSKLREFADDVRDGKFNLPIGRRMQLRDAAEAQRIAEAGGAGKIVLLIDERLSPAR